VSNKKQVAYDPFSRGALSAASPSTAPQRELWVASLAGGNDAHRAFNECLYLTIEGPLVPQAIEAALIGLSERHETLRGTFSADGDHFIIAEHAKLSYSQVDLSGCSEPDKSARFQALTDKEVEVAFDLYKGPLYRVTLVKLTETSHRLIFSAHHVACDGWSLGVLMYELAEMYRAIVQKGDISKASLQPVASFTAYAADQHRRSSSGEGAADRAYWLSRLSGNLTPINLPTDRPRPTERSYAAARLDVTLGAETLKGLRGLGAKAGCTLLITFMGAMQAWLEKCTKQNDLVLGVPSAGQAVLEDESLVGHCVHVLPMRSVVDTQRSFIEHLKAIKPQMLGDFDHQQVTFSSLLPHLNLPKDQSRIALVPVCVNIDVALTNLNFGAPKVDYETVPRKFETFELFVNAVDYKDRLVMECSYNTSLFDEATIARWMRQLTLLIERTIAAPDRPLREISLLDDADQKMIDALNNTAVNRPLVPVHHMIAAKVAEFSGATAVEFGDVKLSYAELDRQANRLARLFMEKGVRRGDCVGVCLSRSERLVVALYAVWKAGAAYVPMDPSYPLNRTQAMADDAAVRLIVGESTLRNVTPTAPNNLLLDEVWDSLASQDDSPVEVGSEATDRAYVLFTSGSTGRPKGVDIRHSALQNALIAIGREIEFGPRNRLLAITTVSFDIAGVELFVPLISGGTVVMCSTEQSLDPTALKKLLAGGNIDFMQATPATWNMLLESGWKGEPGLGAGNAGEAFPPELVEPLLDRAQRGVWNLYGPTETTIYSSIKKMVRGERVTIGKPFDNTQFYILDEALHPVPVGSTGDLWISGAGVAAGYMGRPELTKERFVPDPFLAGQTMYKTGDLARLTPQGEVECLGRTDFQVKIRGFRIELEEIEVALAQFPGVRRSVVTVQEFAQGDKRLVAYVVGEAKSPHDILEHLRARLSPYMVPQHVVCLDEFPLTPNGKINRAALPKPVEGHAEKAKFVKPRTPIEETIRNIFSEVLGRSEISIDDNFFELGGTSLHSIRVVDRINKHGIKATPTMLFQHPSVRQLAEAATRSAESSGEVLHQGSILPLRAHGDRPPIFLVHSLPGDLLGYGHLVHHIGEDQPVYGFHGLGDGELGTDLGEMAKTYATSLEKFYPEGTVHLAGWCFGGTFGMAIAQELQRRGRKIGMLALLECWPARSKLADRARALKVVLGGTAERRPSGREMAKRLLQGDENPEMVEGFALEINEGPFAKRAAVHARNNEALLRYRTKPYSGAISLLRSSDAPRWAVRENDYGWSEFCPNIRVVKVNAEHAEILKPPHVAEVASFLRTELERFS
jgi:amino acid adenylation domain-containing protein